MNRFIRLTFLTAALSGLSSAAVITMTSTATFTGGLDLTIDTPDNDTSTRLTSTLNGVSSTIDLTSMGQVDWLALGTLRLGEGIGDSDVTPNIIGTEYDDGYTLAIDVNTNAGLFSFFAPNSLFSLNFDPGATDDDTTDADAEITVDFSSLNQTVTLGLITYSLRIVDNQFSDNSLLLFNQNATAATVWLRLEVTGVEDPNPGGEVPEAATMGLMGTGLLGIGFLSRRRKAQVRFEPKFA